MRTYLFLAGIVVGLGALLVLPSGAPLYGLVHRPMTVYVSSASVGADNAEPRAVKLVTLLGKDAIPAILDPTIVTAEEAGARFQPNERVLGLSINGEHRAYSVTQLNNHEIVNDVVGEKPVAVTW